MMKSTNLRAILVIYTLTKSIIKIVHFRAERSIKTEETKIRLERSIQTDETKNSLFVQNRSDQGLYSSHSICAFVNALSYGRKGF